jgi:2-haloacid dehalogenase
MADKTMIKAILFDVFGTVVDWRSSIIAELTEFGAKRAIEVDWAQFTDDWRGLYQPSMEAVRSGRRPWMILDVLHRESLDSLIAKYGLTTLSEAEKLHISRVWHRLKPWPDVVEGLQRLKSRYIIGTLSNGNVGLLTRLSKYAGLPWDVVLGAETVRAYKPMPDAYTRNVELLNLAPSEVMLAAAHNSDLAAAAAQGLATAFIARPSEYGQHQTKDLHAEREWVVIADSFIHLADQMGRR